MKCPKCHGKMESVMYDDVEIDRCTKCFGLFFDDLERETLKKMEGSEIIDVGDEFVGARFNDVQEVSCPKCENASMEQITKSEPFEIKYERCPGCKGIYFDAGEFRDYLDDEIYEQFQDIVDQL